MRQTFYTKEEPYEIYSEIDAHEIPEPRMTGKAWAGEVNQDNRKFILWVQQSLNRIMGLRLPVTGMMGPQTHSAIRSFQRRQALQVDGVVGPETKRRLIVAQRHSSGVLDRTLSGSERFGDEFEILGEVCRGYAIGKGDYIKWVQRTFNRLAPYPLPVDGKDGPDYRKRVRLFQAFIMGLRWPTGEVGRKTQNALIRFNEKDQDYIKWVQETLNKEGAGLVVNGNIGSRWSSTRRAIRNFQEKRIPALCVDGFVGAKTELFLIGVSGGPPPT